LKTGAGFHPPRIGEKRLQRPDHKFSSKHRKPSLRIYVDNLS
jgi:hypothetical protein